MAQTTTLANITNLINDRRRDTTDDLVDFNTTGHRAINQTLELMQQLHDWEFTIKRSAINFHKGITWYDLPSSFKAIKDLRRQKNPKDREFDYVSDNSFDNETIATHRMALDTRYNSEDALPVEFLRLETDGDTSQINTATSITADGTWEVGGHTTTISLDAYEYFDLGASLKFNMAGTTGTITNDDMSTKDLNRMATRSKIYLDVFFPTVTNFRSLQLKVGSSDSAYYYATVTTDYLGFTPVANTWNRFEFDPWDTTTGTPDDGAIKYCQLTVAFKGTTTNSNFRFENIFVSEDTPLWLYYYSNDMVYDVGNTETTLVFPDPLATTDYPLWTGKYNYVNESFVDAVLEQVFWITGEQEDQSIARQRQVEIFNNLKNKIPSKRKNPEVKFTLG